MTDSIKKHIIRFAPYSYKSFNSSKIRSPSFLTSSVNPFLETKPNLKTANGSLF